MSWFRSFKNQCSAERWKIPSSSFKEESYFYSLFTFHTEQQWKASIQCPLCISSTLIATCYEYPSMSTRATAWTGQWANNSISRIIWSEMADPVGLCSQVTKTPLWYMERVAWASVQSWYCNLTESVPYCYSRNDKFYTPTLHLLDYQNSLLDALKYQLLVARKGVISKN